MTEEEFVARCDVMGYCSACNAREYVEKHKKKLYSDLDLEEAYRYEQLKTYHARMMKRKNNKYYDI